MRNPFKPLPVEEPEEQRGPATPFSPDPSVGLTTAQVRQHIAEGYMNVPVDAHSKTTKEIVRSNVFTYFNLIFAIIALLLILVGSFRDLTFLPIIIANTVTGIVQEIRSKKVLDNLNVLNAPKATVIRNGKEGVIPSERLVLDDVVKFGGGNQISADAVVLEGTVQVNESLITGESKEITKKPGDHLLSGSFIVSGTCKAQLEKVGPDSYVSRLTLEAKQSRQGEQSEMIRSLNKLVKAVGILIIPIGILLFAQQFSATGNIRTSITSMIAAIIGMIPEGLYLLATVALVVSVMRLAQQKVLVHDMKCIETLARVNVLCVDKTGTITGNDMEVASIDPLPAYDNEKMPPLEHLMGDFAGNMSNDNITMNALRQFFTEKSGAAAANVVPFSSATKYSSVTLDDTPYVLGAPEFVLRDRYADYEETIEEKGAEGYRVLVFGTYDGTVESGKPLTGAVTPLGLVLLTNPIRKEAPETFRYFAQQDVQIKVISGDNPVTVSRIAQTAGIAGAENYVDAQTLQTEEAIDEAISKYTVFGRVTPDQKRKFVHSLKKQGNTVAMTGDGVNDVLALKDADCSIAMASGSQAASQAAQLVLLDNNFACMPSVVLEGRRVVNNVQRSASLFLVKNIFSFLMALFSILFSLKYPLEPTHVSLISLCTIGIPATLLALQPNKARIEGGFLSNVMSKAMPAGLTNFFMIGALVVFGATFTIDAKSVATVATLLMACIGLMVLFEICEPFDVIRKCIFALSILLLLFCSTVLHRLFDITGLSIQCSMLLIVFIFSSYSFLSLANIIREYLKKYFRLVMKKKAEYEAKRAAKNPKSL